MCCGQIIGFLLNAFTFYAVVEYSSVCWKITFIAL